MDVLLNLRGFCVSSQEEEHPALFRLRHVFGAWKCISVDDALPTFPFLCDPSNFQVENLRSKERERLRKVREKGRGLSGEDVYRSSGGGRHRGTR